MSFYHYEVEGIFDQALRFQRRKNVAIDVMKEIRHQFDRLTDSIFFILDLKKPDDLLQIYRQEEENPICKFSDVIARRVHRNHR